MHLLTSTPCTSAGAGAGVRADGSTGSAGSRFDGSTGSVGSRFDGSTGSAGSAVCAGSAGSVRFRFGKISEFRPLPKLNFFFKMTMRTISILNLWPKNTQFCLEEYPILFRGLSVYGL